MKKIINLSTPTIDIRDFDWYNLPIFVVADNKLIGMAVLEEPEGWIVRTGGKGGAYGYKSSLEELIVCGERAHKYEFIVDIDVETKIKE